MEKLRKACVLDKQCIAKEIMLSRNFTPNPKQKCIKKIGEIRLLKCLATHLNSEKPFKLQENNGLV